MAIDGRDMCCEMSWGCEIVGGSHLANWVIAKLGHPPLTNSQGGCRVRVFLLTFPNWVIMTPSFLGVIMPSRESEI